MHALLSRLGTLAVAAVLLGAGGCVLGDHLTTFTIRPDGSAELVIFRSNLRSNEEGAKADKELAAYKEKFDTRTDDELARLTSAGGLIVEAMWLRQQPPLANVVHALLPGAATLEKYLSIKNDDGSPLTRAQFHDEGNRRKLTIEILLATKADAPPASPTSAERLRQAMANGISETRLALERGRVTAARGFIVADDRQSALLDNAVLEDLLRTGGKFELSLEWEVTP